MTVLVTDKGFTPTETRTLPALADLPPEATEVDLSHTDDPTALEGRLATLTLIRVAFPAFNDGRGFTIGRRLRMMGYKGQLLAYGPVISDQYAMLRRTGFDGAEIPDELAERQPEDQWLFRADWTEHAYLAKLRA